MISVRPSLLLPHHPFTTRSEMLTAFHGYDELNPIRRLRNWLLDRWRMAPEGASPASESVGFVLYRFEGGARDLPK